LAPSSTSNEQSALEKYVAAHEFYLFVTSDVIEIEYVFTRYVYGGGRRRAASQAECSNPGATAAAGILDNPPDAKSFWEASITTCTKAEANAGSVGFPVWV
jgi:hypothetical protein